MEFLQQPLVRAAITGFVSAAAVDFAAFRSWKNFDEAVQYDWKTAAFRWFQGVVVGVLTGLGLGAVS